MKLPLILEGSRLRQHRDYGYLADRIDDRDEKKRQVDDGLHISPL